MKKNETLKQSLAGKESELAQALQATNDAREKAQGALKDIQEARRIVAGKAFCSQSNVYIVMGGTLSDKLNSCFSRGVCGPAAQHIRCCPILLD